ncbi:MAG: TraB/GumN family protein [Chitinophagales bacterium]
MKCSKLLLIQHLLLICVLCFFFNTIAAQNSLLWKIEGNNLETTSYLYGTMHSQDKRVHDLGRLAVPYIEASDAVALELIIDSTDLFRMMTSMFGGMMMKDTTLQDLYEREDYQVVKKFIADKMGMFAFLLKVDKMKPLFISLFAEEIATLESPNGHEMDMALDQFFQAVGAEKHKKLIGVETFEEQMGAFNRIPLQEQAVMLLDMAQLEQLGTGEAVQDTSVQTLMYYYLAQDLEGLMEWYDREQNYSDSSFDAVILLERNYRMADRMDKIVQSQATFIAVGALHLPGEDGLIQLLTNKGYELSPVVMITQGVEGMSKMTQTKELEMQKKE